MDRVRPENGGLRKLKAGVAVFRLKLVYVAWYLQKKRFTGGGLCYALENRSCEALPVWWAFAKKKEARDEPFLRAWHFPGHDPL